MFRRIVFGLACVAHIALFIFALKLDWQTWIVPSLLVPYQIINLLRVYVYRSEPIRLKSISLKTFFWLFGMQAIAIALINSAILLNIRINLLATVVILQAIISCILLISVINTWRRIKPKINAIPMTDNELPSLSVLIPARNETSDLRKCLESLIASDYPKLEIIALDDCSTDKRTPEIIRSFASDGVRFIAGEEPESHWSAKNYAYQQLRNQASGEIMVFCGVDVRVEKQTLRHLVEILYTKKRDMLSILPMRPVDEHRKLSFIQAMRYWWEIGFPRRYFNRPPVLSTLWLIRSSVFDKVGGFAAVTRAAVPEAYFAKKLIKHDGYLFLRSTPSLPIFSTKSLDEQYETALRIRYPQLHHQIMMVAVVSFYEIIFLIGPFILVPFSIATSQSWVTTVLTMLSVTMLSLSYYIIAIRTHLNSISLGLLTAPVAFMIDVVMLHFSMITYEFSKIVWHDRTVPSTILEVIPNLPDLKSKQNIPIDE